MKRILFIAITMVIMLAFSSCSEKENLYDKLPTQIQTFASKYYPGMSIAQYSKYQGGSISYYITIGNGNNSALSFYKDYTWCEIDGVGSPISSNIVSDLLPANAVSYINAESNGKVYIIKDFKATDYEYGVVLENSNVFFDKAGNVVVGPSNPDF